jgi:hypothetical protein
MEVAAKQLKINNFKMMKQKQKNKLNMYNTVYSVMQDHKEIWSGVSQLKTIFGKFSENFSRLTALKIAHETDLQPFLNVVLEKRESLLAEVNPIANIILAYAIDFKKPELVKKIKQLKNKLVKSNELDLIENSKIIYRAAKKLYKKSVTEAKKSDNDLVSIMDYGLKEKMIIDLKVAKKEFVASLLALQKAMENKDLTGRQITSVLKKNQRLLKNKIDLLLTIFSTSNPDFYKTYQEARVIQKTQIDNVKKGKSKKKDK